MFFNCLTSCYNINIHHVHICSDYLYPTIGWTFANVTNIPWNIFYNLVNFKHSVILCPFKPHMWHAYENVFVVFDSIVLPLWLPLWSITFCMFPHYDYSFHKLCNTCQSSLYYSMFYGIESAFLALAIVIPSSHNIVASLCCYSVECLILAITILKYDCKPTLNTIVKKVIYGWYL